MREEVKHARKTLFKATADRGRENRTHFEVDSPKQSVRGFLRAGVGGRTQIISVDCLYPKEKQDALYLCAR